MERYWVYLEAKIQGPVEIPNLRKIPGFTLLTQVCAEGQQSWRMADEVIEIKSYFLAPPRISSMPLEMGNAVSVREAEVEAPPALTIIHPGPMEETLPLEKDNPALALPVAKAASPVVETLPEASGPPALRLFCSVCGYKNPRDVTACMKCGSPVKTGPKAAEPMELPDQSFEHLRSEAAAKLPLPGPAVVAEAIEPVVPSPMVEIPVARIAAIMAIASSVGFIAIFGYRLWSARSRPRATIRRTTATAPATVHAGAPVNRRVASARTLPVKHRAPASALAARAAHLPGLSASPRAGSAVVADSNPLPRQPAHELDEAEVKTGFKVIEEASPLRHRVASPITSPYAKKRRANQALWTEQEQQAIQQVQRARIYGGQRTIQRNTEILMQILRDREYNNAFETGKRPLLYNDMDWGASAKEGPLYEVRLTFSGGKEADGTPRKPLRFAFDADMERGTVEAGGDDQSRANTMHAFFDESRIPPEERRAIPKDTEELVLAAQPDASPLALDTVMRHFVATYSAGALQRVASAFGLNLVTKKLLHEPQLSSPSVMPEPDPAVTSSDFRPVTKANRASAFTADQKPAPDISASAPVTKMTTRSNSGPIEFQLQRGAGRERQVAIRVPSSANPGRIWELVTGYENLKQFVPDLLVSEREGKDGAASIVHAVALTRLMFFVFKINLHLRIIEHPQERTLEFERIAGEFESFRGSIQVASDPTTHATYLALRASVVPQGFMPNWAFSDMTRRFLVPVLDAIRCRAESN